MLRAQTTTTRKAEIPFGLDYRTNCWCHEHSVISGQSQIHHSSNGKITTAELYLWQQNIH